MFITCEKTPKITYNIGVNLTQEYQQKVKHLPVIISLKKSSKKYIILQIPLTQSVTKIYAGNTNL